MLKVKINILIICVLFLILNCKGKNRNEENPTKTKISSRVSLQKRKDTAYVKGKILYVVDNDKTRPYEGLIKNYSSLYTSIKCFKNSFLISYEYSGGSTKMICTYKFMYNNPLKIIYKEVVKFNNNGTASNIVFFDDKPIEINYNVLEGLFENLQYDYIQSGKQEMRVYLKEKYLGIFKSNNYSSEYFINSPILHGFKSIDYGKIKKSRFDASEGGL